MSISCTFKRVWSSYELLLLLLLIPRAHLKESHTCALYDPPTPGIHCFHGDKAEKEITNSKWVWMLEMYSGWCGHCQNFAPKIIELAHELKAWSRIIKVGVLECPASPENQDACGRMGVQAYPTVRFFRPHDPKPLEFMNKITGSRAIPDLRHLIVDHIVSITPPPKDWPNFELLLDSDILEEMHSKWSPSIFIFEKENSYLGKELILDLLNMNSLRVRRISVDNSILVRHYSILEHPSVVVEVEKDHYHIMTKNSVTSQSDEEFRGQILHYIHGNGDTKLASSQSHDASAHRVVKDHQKIKQQPQRNRVDYRDLLNTVSYALRYEIPVHSFISGSAYSTLFDFVSLLEQILPKIAPQLELVAKSLLDIRFKLGGNNMDGFVTNKEWKRIVNTKLSSAVFPTEPTWRMCNGSQPHYRGYPCGLWMLMHTLTLHTLHITTTSSTRHAPSPSPSPSPSSPINSMDALKIVVNFIKHFFTCEACRAHFSEMSSDVSLLGRRGGGDDILWLWEAHNAVNARLHKEGGGDPTQPKSLFPSISRCPYCYQRSHDQGGVVVTAAVVPDFNNTGFNLGESMMLRKVGEVKSGTVLRGQEVLGGRPYNYMWNRTAILLYMWNYYHLDPIHGNETRVVEMQRNSDPGYHLSQYSILQAAWPNTYTSYSRHGKPEIQGGEFNQVDSSLSTLMYFACVLLLVAVGAWLVRKRHLKKHMPTTCTCSRRKLFKSFSKYFNKNNSNHLYMFSL